MRLIDAYHLLEVDSNASDETVRRAWLDLTKVWHPDRFGSDAELRAKAQEKLKAINEAYEVIQSARAGNPLAEEPLAPRPMLRRYVTFAIACGAAALLILLRRPTRVGLIIAAILFLFAALTIARLRRMS